jgi:hypothetical protein
MHGLAEKVNQALFPERIRPYITFRLMTIFVVLGAVWNIGLSVLMKDRFSGFRHTESWVHYMLYSPYYSALYNLVVGIGFWIIYATRKKTEYYQLRVLCYGMLLGGVAGEVLGRLL